MADAPKVDPPDIADIQKTLEKQISELRKEITKINKSISKRSTALLDDARDTASEVYDSASGRASQTAQQLPTQAQSVSEAARENPRTTAALVGMATFVGILIGLAATKASSDASGRWY